MHVAVCTGPWHIVTVEHKYKKRYSPNTITPTHPSHTQLQSVSNSQHTCTVCLPVVEHSRPCRRDSCTGPSRPQPPAEHYDARGLSDSLCRVCGHARCVQSSNRAGPPRCHHTATPLLHTHTNTHISDCRDPK